MPKLLLADPIKTTLRTLIHKHDTRLDSSDGALECPKVLKGDPNQDHSGGALDLSETASRRDAATVAVSAGHNPPGAHIYLKLLERHPTDQ